MDSQPAAVLTCHAWKKMDHQYFASFGQTNTAQLFTEMDRQPSMVLIIMHLLNIMPISGNEKSKDESDRIVYSWDRDPIQLILCHQRIN